MPLGETIVALSTPAGQSAIALIRLSGPACEVLSQQVLRGKPLIPRQAACRQLISLSGDILDEVVALFFQEGASYTGEPMLEISCHGNPLIVQRIIEDLIERGCRLAEPGEFTRTAYLNDRMDLAQAEAVADLIHAQSHFAIQAAQKQLGGHLGEKMAQLTDALLTLQAQVEAYIDFPEEDLPAEDNSGPLASLAAIIGHIDTLIETAHYKQALADGIQTVIAGAPNAGKSSLLNVLLGEDRSIVSPEPGTTRDYITERIILGPYTLRITDTAGLHEAGNRTEALGIRRSHERIEQADVVMLVIDASQPPHAFEHELLKRLHPGNCLVVFNKSDLVVDTPDIPQLSGYQKVSVSARHGSGLPELRRMLLALLEVNHIVPHPDALLISARHASALSRAREYLTAARQKLCEGEASELAGSDIREAVEAIGQIVGKIDNEALLDKLFANFCIGK